jgi:hypothetical protein
LLAIKWLGNEGSDGGTLTNEDSLDGFVLLERVLSEHYERRKHVISRLIGTIIRRKGRSRGSDSV